MAATVVVVEGEVVVDVEWADEPVVVGTLAAGCRAPEQLAAAMASATRTAPVAARPLATEPIGRRSRPGCESGRLR